jgi:DNA-binding response OmpR family regulator
MAKILVVEDNKIVNTTISRLLESNNYDVESVYSAEDALAFVSKKNYDLIVLDLNLPNMNGYHFLRVLRTKSNVPVIINTAHSSVKARVKLIQAGASDFIEKTYTSKEILESIKIILNDRQKEKEHAKSYMYKNLVFDFTSRLVTKSGVPLDLTNKELEILKLLFEHPDKPFSRKQLYLLVWGEEYADNVDNTINVHVKRLRDKIEEDPKNPKIIETVYAFGYRLGSEVISEFKTK